jgi:fucose permease
MVALVLVTFFVISLLTNVLGPIVPDIIAGFHVSLTAAGFLAFAFFIAYGVMSIPAGFLVERFSEKPVMMLAFLAAGLGSLSFALFPGFRMAMGSYFVIGAGMAVLQVAINPLLRVSGGQENYAFYSAFAQLVFGSASFVSPRIYSFLVSRLGSTTTHRNVVLRVLANLTPPHLPWASIYWIFTVSAFAMVFVLALSHFPKVKHTAQERPGSLAMYKTLLRQRVVWLYFAAMFAYVSCEQGAADWMSSFLQRYHGFDPHSAGATAVSWFWGLLTAGCLGGMLLLKFFDSRRVLIGASVGALGCLSAALFGSARLSLIAFPAIGLFASVMWPIIVSLALNSVKEYQGSFSGILGTGIIGGAVVPVLIGRMGDFAGLRGGLALLYVTFGIVLTVGFWARPLVSNVKIHTREAPSEVPVGNP